MQKFNKNTIMYILIIGIFLIGIYYFFIRDKDYIEDNHNLSISNSHIENVQNENIDLNKKEENKIIIYITGEVKNEGIYEIKENSRIADIIKVAGGLTEEANINNINLAFLLEDGMKIHIPKYGEDINEIKDDTSMYISKENNEIQGIINTNKNSKNNKININNATQTELESLPGIGKSTALNIINYRKENGKFSNIEDIKKVSGIGDSKYNKIKDLIDI